MPTELNPFDVPLSVYLYKFSNGKFTFDATFYSYQAFLDSIKDENSGGIQKSWRLVLGSVEESASLVDTSVHFCIDSGAPDAYTKFIVSQALDMDEFIKNFSLLANEYTTVVYEVLPTPVDPNLAVDMKRTLCGLISNFHELEKCLNTVSSVEDALIMARFIHMVQSSGYGKTKLCLEFINRQRQGLYFVTRQSSSSGFPPAPTWASQFIILIQTTAKTDDQCEYLWLRLILAALQNFGQNSIRETNLVEMFSKSSIKTKNYVPPDCLSEFTLSMSDISIRSTENAHDVVQQIYSRAEELGLISSDSSGVRPLFTLIFDEASELLNSPNSNCIALYRTLRRALARLKQIHGLVAVFVGTKSSMNEFDAFYSVDFCRSSSRILRKEDMMHHFIPRPFVLANNVDVQRRPIVIDYESLISGRKSEFEEGLIYYGRPLWAAFKTYSNALDVAKTKLNFFGQDDWKLNALLVRICATICPQGDLVNRMVQSGMATLMYIDETGSQCYTTFVAEPVLSNAARLSLNDSMDLLAAIKDLYTQIGRGIMQKGQSGELVARIILLGAMDFRGSDQNVVIKRVDHFLKDLCGNEYKNPEALYADVMNGLVSFSQFINLENVGPQIKFRVSQDLLKHAFVRGVSLVLPAGTRGADMIIPVLKADNSMTCLVIQIKNLKSMEALPVCNQTETRKVLDKLKASFLSFLDLNTPLCDSLQDPDPQKVQNEFVPIVIQFKSGGTNTELCSEPKYSEWLKIPSTQKQCLWITGLNTFSSFASSIIEPLQNILNGEFHYYNHLPDSDWNALSPGQSSKVGMCTRLFTSNPLANPGYLAYASEAYQSKYPKERETVKTLMDKAELVDLKQNEKVELRGVEHDDCVMQD
jgi:hypothetical protein